MLPNIIAHENMCVQRNLTRPVSSPIFYIWQHRHTPNPLAGFLELAMQVPHERDERACATIRRDDGGAIGASQRVLGVVAYGASKEAAVEV
jgi:hypothetical protein